MVAFNISFDHDDPVFYLFYSIIYIGKWLAQFSVSSIWKKSKAVSAHVFTE